MDDFGYDGEDYYPDSDDLKIQYQDWLKQLPWDMVCTLVGKAGPGINSVGRKNFKPFDVVQMLRRYNYIPSPRQLFAVEACLAQYLAEVDDMGYKL